MLASRKLRSRTPRRRTVALGATAALVTAVAGISLASPAYAADGILIKNVETGRCLSGAFDGSVRTYTCDPGFDGQRWRMIPAVNNCVRYQNVWTGQFLDSYNDGGDPVDPVQTKPDNGSDYQVWCYMPDQKWMPNRATLKLLDSNYNGDVYALPSNGGHYQQWDGVK